MPKKTGERAKDAVQTTSLGSSGERCKSELDPRIGGGPDRRGRPSEEGVEESWYAGVRVWTRGQDFSSTLRKVGRDTISQGQAEEGEATLRKKALRCQVCGGNGPKMGLNLAEDDEVESAWFPSRPPKQWE